MAHTRNHILHVHEPTSLRWEAPPFAERIIQRRKKAVAFPAACAGLFPIRGLILVEKLFILIDVLCRHHVENQNLLRPTCFLYKLDVSVLLLVKQLNAQCYQRHRGECVATTSVNKKESSFYLAAYIIRL